MLWNIVLSLYHNTNVLLQQKEEKTVSVDFFIDF